MPEHLVMPPGAPRPWGTARTGIAKGGNTCTLTLPLASVADSTVPKARLSEPPAPLPAAAEEPLGCTVEKGTARGPAVRVGGSPR